MRQPRSTARAVSIALLLAPALAAASLIQLPFIGGRDTAMVGNVVATPENGGSILLQNPAGIVGLQGSVAEASAFLFRPDVKYENAANGFKTTSSELAVAPAVFLGSGALAPWYLGAGLYGTTGASFNFPGSAAAGFPNRFLGELTVIQLGLVAGRELTPGLRVAIELSPTYGRIRAHFPSPLGPVSVDTDGLGIGGTIGFLYDVSEATTLGLAYRSPSVVYLRGDGEAGPASTDTDLNLHLPQSVAFGFAYHLTPKLTLGTQARWTDYPQLTEGTLEFSRAPALNQPLLRDTRATFRYGAALEYAANDITKLRCGVSREQWMIEEKAMSPLLLDNSDVLLGGGLGIDLHPFFVEAMLGIPVSEDRVISASENPTFAGRYSQEGIVWAIGARYRF